MGIALIISSTQRSKKTTYLRLLIIPSTLILVTQSTISTDFTLIRMGRGWSFRPGGTIVTCSRVVVTRTSIGSMTLQWFGRVWGFGSTT
jgi:hypothetical protein